MDICKNTSCQLMPLWSFHFKRRIFKVYGNPSHCLPSCWTKHYVNTAKKASYIKEIKHKGIVLFIVNTVCHEYKYIGDAKETK